LDIVIFKIALLVCPVTSVTVTLTVYVPGELHDLVTEEPVAPLFQLYVYGETPPDALAENV
jgi:hypothetical protein